MTLAVDWNVKNQTKQNLCSKEVHYRGTALYLIRASSRENLSLGFLKKGVSYQSPQLQRLARKLKFHL